MPDEPYDYDREPTEEWVYTSEPSTTLATPHLFDLEEEDDLLQRLVYPLDTQTRRVATFRPVGQQTNERIREMSLEDEAVIRRAAREDLESALRDASIITNEAMEDDLPSYYTYATANGVIRTGARPTTADVGDPSRSSTATFPSTQYLNPRDREDSHSRDARMVECDADGRPLYTAEDHQYTHRYSPNADGELYNYDYTPPFWLIDAPTGARTFGIELEVNAKASIGASVSSVARYVYRCGEKLNAYCVHDGSLDPNLGLEVVFHPRDLVAWRRTLASSEFAGLMDIIVVPSRSYRHYGLHVHVGRQTLSLDEVKALVSFTNRYDLARILIAAGGRPFNNFAAPSATYVSTPDALWGHFAKYVVTNITHDTSVEFRFMKATKNVALLETRILFIDALVEWIHKKNYKTITAQQFVDHLAKNKEYQRVYTLIKPARSEEAQEGGR